MYQLVVTALAILQLPLLMLFLLWLFLVITARRREDSYDYTPSLTVLVPAYNEASRIERCVKALLASDYPDLRVVVVDDGSTDDTAAIALKAGAEVLRLPHMGKAPALNTALGHVDTEVIVVLDADTIVAKDTLRKLVAPLRDPKVGAVFGRLLPANRGVLPAFQEIEYIYVGELALAHYAHNVPMPFIWGALSAFKTDVLREVGGFPLGTAGEDVDLLYTILESGYEAAPSTAVAHTEVPRTLPQLFKQRWRWISSGVRIFWKHIRRIRSPKHLYTLILYPFWPVYGVLSFPLLLYMFFYWLARIPPDYIPVYLLSWFTYYGPIHTLLHLSEWGVNFPLLVGLSLGLVSLALFLVALHRNGVNIRRLLTLSVFPIYGTFILGAVLFTSIFALLRPANVFKR